VPHAKYALAPIQRRPGRGASNLAQFDGMHYGQPHEQKADLIRTYAKSRPSSAGSPAADHDRTFVLSSGYKDAYYVKALKAAGW